MVNEWADDGYVAPEPIKRILVVAGLLFAKRGAKLDEYKDEFSSTLFEEVINKHKDTAKILVTLPAGKWPKILAALEEVIKDQDTVRFVVLDTSSVLETTKRVQLILEDMGAEFRNVRNARTVSYLNLAQTAVRPEITSVSLDDHEKLGVAPDKEVTMDDLIRLRQRDAWP